MRYGSVCSGIEAATVAWHSLGWTPAFFSEIEPYPCAALGNSMAVPCMQWIGARIQMVNELLENMK